MDFGSDPYETLGFGYEPPHETLFGVHLGNVFHTGHVGKHWHKYKSKAEATEGAAGKIDKLKDKLQTAAIVLASVVDGKVSLIAGVTKDATAKVKAGELVNFVAQQVGGKGGGRPDMAQAGGTDPSGLPAALAGVAGWVGERA